MVAPTPTDEEKKAERLAKLEAWKQKQAAERTRKQKEIDSSGGTRKLLDEIDKKERLTPAVETPAAPHTPVDDVSPTPYAGKFDPKAIVRKATAISAGVAKLGTDIALPDIAKTSPISHPNNTGLKANKTADALNASIGKSIHLDHFVPRLTLPTSPLSSAKSPWEC